MPRWLLGRGSRLARVVEPAQATAPRTTGALQIPEEDNLTLNLYAVNYADQPARVDFALDRLPDSGRAERIFRQALTVPAQGADSIRLDAPAGQTVALSVLLPAELEGLVVPSATVVQFFPADAGTLPVVNVTPPHFVPTGPDAADGADGGNGDLTRTWGLLDVAQGVAAARPALVLIAYNTDTVPQQITLRIRSFVREVNRFDPLLERSFTVPGGGTVRFETSDPEGRTVEVAVTGSRRVVPTLLQQQAFLATGETNLLVRYGPEDLAVVGGLAR
ncbi:MAG TPA: hypothetical protein VF282_06805 [Bacillota bacterium]